MEVVRKNNGVDWWSLVNIMKKDYAVRIEQEFIYYLYRIQKRMVCNRVPAART